MNATVNATYNPKVVAVIDRVLLVVTVLVSAVLIFAGVSAGQDASASIGTQDTQQVSTVIYDGGSLSSRNSGGTLAGW